MAQYMPKTLAKTLSYILVHSPGEYGLFWNPDGTMPWKELYWALQEDPSLRFVRETHLREIAFLGIEFPVELEGNLLRLKNGIPTPVYPVSEDPPERLYYACRRKYFPVLLEHGVSPSNRPRVPIASDKELALRLGRRRDPEPILVEVLAGKAASDGIAIEKAGPELYLVHSVPVEYLVTPPMREDVLLKMTEKRSRKDRKPPREDPSRAYGSFFMDVQHLQEVHGEKGTEGKKRKGRRGPEWKREARKERTKRSV